MKGTQVLMLIALFAISTCTKGDITDKIKKYFNIKEKKENKESTDVMSLHTQANPTDEDLRQIKVAQEYLDHFDDDTVNLTNDPIIQIIVDSKKTLKEVAEDLLKEMEQLKNKYDSDLAEVKRLNSYIDGEVAEVSFDREKLWLDENFVKNTNSIVRRAEINSNEAFLKAYKGLFNHN